MDFSGDYCRWESGHSSTKVLRVAIMIYIIQVVTRSLQGDAVASEGVACFRLSDSEASRSPASLSEMKRPDSFRLRKLWDCVSGGWGGGGGGESTELISTLASVNRYRALAG